MSDKKLTTVAGCPVAHDTNVMTAGPRGPMLLQDVWFLEKLAHFDREVIPERRMHAKGSGAFGTFTVTSDITKYTRAKLFSQVGKKTEMFARFSTVAGERGAADAERDIRGFALKFYTEEGNWDMVGNNTPVFFLRDPLRFPDLNHAVKRDPRTNMRSAKNNWDFWTGLPEALHQITVVKRANISVCLPTFEKILARVYRVMSLVTVNVPKAPEPLACMRRSGITSRSKWASFSRNQTSCSSIGPRGPAVITLVSWATGQPATVVKSFFSLISCLR